MKKEEKEPNSHRAFVLFIVFMSLISIPVFGYFFMFLIRKDLKMWFICQN